MAVYASKILSGSCQHALCRSSSAADNNQHTLANWSPSDRCMAKHPPKQSAISLLCCVMCAVLGTTWPWATSPVSTLQLSAFMNVILLFLLCLPSILQNGCIDWGYVCM
jgi:hypothetical protein